MALDIKLLDIIACPVCKGKLHYQPQSDKAAHELICRFDRLAYPLEEGIPVLQRIPLARALYRDAQLNNYIPADQIEATAEVLRWLEQWRQSEGPQW